MDDIMEKRYFHDICLHLSVLLNNARLASMYFSGIYILFPWCYPFTEIYSWLPLDFVESLTTRK